jgi:transcriptional regulator with XRE-family HTH domain
MTADDRIGQNLVTLRGERSQKDVADAMRARGWKWSQATVWSIEKGERPLRLAEADDLADVLGSSFSGVYAFLNDPDTTAIAKQLRRVAEADAALSNAIQQYETERKQLAILADWRAADDPAVDHEQVRAWLKRGLSAVVKTYRADAASDEELSALDSPHLTTWKKAR